MGLEGGDGGHKGGRDGCEGEEMGDGVGGRGGFFFLFFFFVCGLLKGRKKMGVSTTGVCFLLVAFFCGLWWVYLIFAIIVVVA